MNTVFVGGSRDVANLSQKVKERLDKVIQNNDRVIVGDANGVDKAVQKYLAATNYENVLIYCSGAKSRNNVGHWPVHHVDVPDGISGFQFYAAKDRKMAEEADFGLMIWDGKSPGTLLNVLRLVADEKKAVLHKANVDVATVIKSKDQWQEFISACDAELIRDLEKRATKDELVLIECKSSQRPEAKGDSEPETEVAQNDLDDKALLKNLSEVNFALKNGNVEAFMNWLGEVARLRGMTNISRDSGLARESLYRSLNSDGNPEFTTVLKVLGSVGIQFEVKLTKPKSTKKRGRGTRKDKSQASINFGDANL